MNTKQFTRVAYEVTKAMMAVAAARLERLEVPVTNHACATMAADMILKLFEAANEVGIGKKKEE